MVDVHLFPAGLSFNFSLASVTAALCIFCVFWTCRIFPAKYDRSCLRHNSDGRTKRRYCTCSCTCVTVPKGTIADSANRDLMVGSTKSLEKQTSGSIMEQLVPEIRTHALSYLDYPSLCRLSMTNTWMRKAANDDNAWKALYHKDFTIEQVNITPHNGWKAYYASTKAIMSVNARFYDVIKERSLSGMGRLWLQRDYVKCIHSSGELFSGYAAVLGSWEITFNWAQEVDFQVRDVKSRVLQDAAWLTMKAYANVEAVPFHVTNVFENHNGKWYMVHHHSSIMFIEGQGENRNLRR